MQRRTFCSLAAALALTLVVAGCGGGGDGAQLGRRVESPTTESATKGDSGGVAKQASAYVAQAIVPQLAVYTTPGDPAPTEQLPMPVATPVSPTEPLYRSGRAEVPGAAS